MTTSCDRTDGKKRREPSFLYNPYEIAFRGFWGTNWQILPGLLRGDTFAEHRVAFVKHRFLDASDSPRPGSISGGCSDVEHWAIYPTIGQQLVKSQPLLDADLVFVETSDELGIPQIVYHLDAEPSDSNVFAYVGNSRRDVGLTSQAGFFDLDTDMSALKASVRSYFQEVVRDVPLYGLVLAGGKSTRMKQDKANLEYRGKPQVEYCYELLSRYCKQVFVSNRSDQAADAFQRALPQIHDTFLDIGPMGGILSALKSRRRAAWLALACDLPFVDENAIETLLNGRNPYKLATAFVSENDGLPEPLCAIYEPKSVFRLLHFLALGYQCPRKVLINSDTCLLKQPAAHVMTNVNSPDEYAEARRLLAKEGCRTK